MNLFIILLIVILVIIYVCTGNKDNFTIGYNPNFLFQEPVDYSTKEQNCDELTFSPTECVVDTVVPSNKIVCTESLTPITNNEKDCRSNNKKNKKNKKNPTLSLIYDFDLLSSFNNAQINNDQINNDQINNDDMINKELESFDDLKTDVRSLASLENDNLSNY
jgi:hypothetical protein